ncbi:endonuclease [Alteromonas sp. KC3]|uniref:endonuclease/exonuclease/phosphatase family protein n=1 Tax=unclassified Alteromonas TaxID=2614992 RepID=UPI0019224595|nr:MULTISPECIES: endonuclease/exonuclease/phosphatase family protein [unclassified Alteromonas]BCO18268.1 endonuclease [Alteromonas sp. KC3]BCO22228.1 endonuclease [Alteromonas sp. KC14]
MKTKAFFMLFSIMPFMLVAQTLKVATFNVSMESTNYKSLGMAPSEKVLAHILSNGEHPQVRNIAEIIQRVRPDIILLNEFDYIKDKNKGINAFVKNYLNVSQAQQQPIDYPYTYIAPVNTGAPTPFDLDNNGKVERFGGDAFGYGLYEGQYGMALLSKYPIDETHVRTFQFFKWHHMPHPQKPFLPSASGEMEESESWYDEEEWAAFRLSSKSHWDVPINVGDQVVHILAMHPTPPNFDGEEDRNGKRNADEIRLMADYLTPDKGIYIYDDNSNKVTLEADSRFVLVGDFNAADIGDKYREGVIEQLTNSPYVNNSVIPKSAGGAQSSAETYSERYTAYWGARADYVLPSSYGFEVVDAGVFWPAKTSDLHRLVKDRQASSDHRLVWTTLSLSQ